MVQRLLRSSESAANPAGPAAEMDDNALGDEADVTSTVNPEEESAPMDTKEDLKGYEECEI